MNRSQGNAGKTPDEIARPVPEDRGQVGTTSLSSTLNIVVRPMELTDLEAAHEIDRQSFSLPWPERAYRFELVENKNSRLWVAETVGSDGRGAVVGLTVAWLIVDEAHIATLAVLPEYRQSGIGSRLLATILSDAYEQGMRSAALEVRAGNLPAQKLYRDFGFVEVGRRKGYYLDNGEDAILLTLHKMDEAYIVGLENRGLMDKTVMKFPPRKADS